jgi:hypothetical protein
MPRRELLTPTERVQIFAIPSDESELIRLATLARGDLTYLERAVNALRERGAENINAARSGMARATEVSGRDDAVPE